MRAKLREIAEKSGSDPRGAILSAVGNVSWFKVARYRILVGTYVRPEKTAGGIILADASLQEDRFQGKVGLVLAMGPLAFSDDNEFQGVKANIGDWVVYDPADTYELFIIDRNSIKTSGSSTSCRMMEDVNVKAIIDDPLRIW